MFITNLGTDGGNPNTGVKILTLDRTKYGSIYSYWLFDKDYNSSLVAIKDTQADTIILCGTWKNTGLCLQWAMLANNSTGPVLNAPTSTVATNWTVGGNVDANSSHLIKAPAGGVG
jgi:hypothetical protein